MGVEGKPQNLRDHDREDQMMMKKKDMIIINEDDCRSTTVDTAASSSLTSSIGNDDDDDSSTVSNGSSSLMDDDDTRDDASSSSSSNSNSTGALYDLSELMAELPIKRGLSRYYNGKSDSFTCLSRVRSIEDLAKKEAPYNNNIRKKNKGLDSFRLFTLPKPVISKKSCGRRSFMKNTTNSNSRPPRIPLRKATFNNGG